ncbi:MAG: lipoate--protein ligase family protein [Ignavibacteriae bacterium]|nr:lipoate--protein ligase family protein [Ignavibacteriota bacterium]
MSWLFEHTGAKSGAFNMQYDEQLAREIADSERLPTIRVYGWSPVAISYGWNQSLDDIDTHAAERAGIDIVRRPTGGRAILHSDELTYSVISDLYGFENLEVLGDTNISAIYRLISEALLCGLEKLGVGASLEKSQPDFPSLYRATSGAACFSSSARHEIKFNGRKLVGSAQRRFWFHGKEIILQHGSILLGNDHLRIAEFLKFESDAERDALLAELSMKTTDVKSILNRAITFEEVAAAIQRGFEKKWALTFESHLKDAVRTL